MAFIVTVVGVAFPLSCILAFLLYQYSVGDALGEGDWVLAALIPNVSVLPLLLCVRQCEGRHRLSLPLRSAILLHFLCVACSYCYIMSPERAPRLISEGVAFLLSVVERKRLPSSIPSADSYVWGFLALSVFLALFLLLCSIAQLSRCGSVQERKRKASPSASHDMNAVGVAGLLWRRLLFMLLTACSSVLMLGMPPTGLTTPWLIWGFAVTAVALTGGVYIVSFSRPENFPSPTCA